MAKARRKRTPSARALTVPPSRISPTIEEVRQSTEAALKKLAREMREIEQNKPRYEVDSAEFARRIDRAIGIERGLIAPPWMSKLKKKAGSQQLPPPPTAIVDPLPSKSPGRPEIMDEIKIEAARRIREREVVPTPKGYAQFCRDLWQWWEQVRGERKAVEWRSIANNKRVRSIWNGPDAEGI